MERIFQILITDGPVTENRFSDVLKQNIASFRSLYPNAAYHLYTQDDIIDFLGTSFPKEVTEAYHALTPYAFKADLARYCLLYEYGGVYSDLSYLHMRPIIPAKGKNLVVFRDVPGHPSWSTSNAVFYAAPKHPVFQRAIDRILSHHATGYYGMSPLDVSGPYMFGRVLAEGDDWTTTQFGDSRVISQEPSGRSNIVKIMPDGAIVALRNKEKNCSIDELVQSHSNDYARLWRKKQVWHSPSKRSLFKRTS